jgi:Fe-S-cluster containining protein
MKKNEYNCIKCGKCCRTGLEILIRKEDVLRWIRAERHDYIQYVQIDPKSISSEGLGGYHIEEENALLKLLKVYSEKEYEKKKIELEAFILKNHIYQGKDNIPLPIYTFIPDLGRNPILIPRSFQIMLEGMNWGIVYVLKYKSNRCCPFQKDNLCSIHDIKPTDCKRFPYDKEGKLKTDSFFLKICKGIKSLQEEVE